MPHLEEGFFALVVAAVVYCCLFDDSGNGDMLHLTMEENLAPESACQNVRMGALRDLRPKPF